MSSNTISHSPPKDQQFVLTCSSCERQHENLLACGSCFFEKYCSKECQKADWPKHRDVCKLMKDHVQSWPKRRVNSLYSEDKFATVCTRIFPMLKEHFNVHVKDKRALDLGCGPGASTIYLLQKGWSVIAVDNNGLSIGTLDNRIRTINKEWLEIKKLIILRQNIGNYDFEGKFDLIVVNDVFPYLNPKNILDLMGKIYNALNKGGHLVGTFFEIRALASGAGKFGPWSKAWLVSDIGFVKKTLAKFHYETVECRYRPKHYTSSVIEFSAKK